MDKTEAINYLKRKEQLAKYRSEEEVKKSNEAKIKKVMKEGKIYPEFRLKEEK